MKQNVYLVFSSGGFKRARVTPPDLYSGEIAIRIVANIPSPAFRAFPTAELDIDEKSYIGDALKLDVTKMTASQLDGAQNKISVELSERIAAGDSKK